jgi:hypothetical protein
MLGNGSNSRNEDCIVWLFSASNQINGEGATEWVLENTVLLSRSSSFSMLGVADGKLLLQGAREHNSEEVYGCISLDFKTRQVQRVWGIIHNGRCPMVAQYIGYPPSLSLPTIWSGKLAHILFAYALLFKGIGALNVKAFEICNVSLLSCLLDILLQLRQHCVLYGWLFIYPVFCLTVGGLTGNSCLDSFFMCFCLVDGGVGKHVNPPPS